MIKPQGFIFDLDGTLVDSMGIWKQIDIQYLGKFGISLPEGLQEEIEGFSFTETAVYFKNRFGIKDSIEQIKQEWNDMTYQIYQDEVGLKPGVTELLDYAQKHQIPCAIATSNSIELVRCVLKSNKIDSYFTTIVTGCDVGKSKPEPDVYLCAASRMGISPEKCMVFEDIVPGIEGAHRAGMPVCVIDDAYSRYQETEKRKKADYYVTDFCQMIEQLENMEET